MVRYWIALVIVSFFITRAPLVQASTVYNAYSTQTAHVIGAPASATSWGVSSTSSPGYLTYGPNVSQFQNGSYRATFSLKVDNNAADDRTIGYIDVFDDVSQTVLARREFHRKDFSAAGAAQDFDITFVTRGANQLEFRVFYFGYSYLEHMSTTLDLVSDFAPAKYLGASSSLLHQIGNIGPSSSWEAPSSAGSGWLTYGPYASQFTAGSYSAQFSLMVDDTSADDLNVATFDVYDSGTNRVIVSRPVTRHEFLAPLSTQTFAVPFSYSGAGPLEFRIFVSGHSYVRHVSTTVASVSPQFWSGNDPQLSHQLGSSSGTGWAATTEAGPGFLTYGPYTTSVPAGVTTATFTLLEDNNSADNTPVARIEAYDSTSGIVLASRLIRRQNFWNANVPQTFDLVFESSRASMLEFRVYTFGQSYLDHISTAVAPDRLTLTSLWDSGAHFEFRKRDIFQDQEGLTSSLIVLDGIWYQFNRQTFTKAGCRDEDAIRSVVRQSFDRGQTWSNPVTIVEPGNNVNAFDGCDVVDGSGFYDSDTDTWHYLAQCIGGPNVSWTLCHYTRNGMSPIGSFVSDPANPVVASGQLWNAICTGITKHCPSGTVDEGTPQIVSKENGQFTVTFHGAHGSPQVNGYRGVATTNDFHQWQVTGASLPGDALLSPVDCNSWGGWNAGGCIGFGAARLLRSDGYNYILAEAADTSLNCVAGQRWVFGLLRNETFGSSETWTNYARNAYVENQNVSPVGCALTYMNMVRDRGDIYLMFAPYTPDYGFPNYTYQLVSGAGPSKLLTK